MGLAPAPASADAGAGGVGTSKSDQRPHGMRLSDFFLLWRIPLRGEALLDPTPMRRRGNRKQGRTPPLPWLATVGILACLVAAGTALELGIGARPPAGAWLVLGLTFARHAIELVCGVYAVAFVWASIHYWRARDRGRPGPESRATPPAAVLYLCCDDLEEEALLGLSGLRYGGPLLFLLHDDSTDPEARRRVDRAVQRMAAETGVRWRVLRRPEKTGGKPGALQYVLRETAAEYEYFLLADNDSYVADPTVLQRSMGSFADPRVAAVQFRNRSHAGTGGRRFVRCLAHTVDIFDAFMTGLYERLWTPFVGHNAVLETRAVLAAGGFTAGFFADDIDLTVRMNLQGRRVAYRRDLCMGEGHPPSYGPFCARARKWAHGCAQVLVAHLGSVLASPAMSLREKLGFLLFCGLYLAQVAMLAYVAIVFVLLPLAGGGSWSATWPSLAVGTLLPLTVFLPVVTYLRTEGRRLPFFRTLLASAATYGSTDVWTFQGLRNGFTGRARAWVPTNAVGSERTPWVEWAHFAAGAAIVGVPLALQPGLLLFPLTWILAAKYLFVPAVAVYYGPLPDRREPLSSTIWREAGGVIAGITLVGALLVLLGGEARGQAPPGESRAAPPVEVREGRLRIGGEPFLLRGVHYSPWRPGQGPGRGFPYPSGEELEGDLQLIRELNANAILAYDPPFHLVELADRMGLLVLCVFHIEWWRIPAGQADAIRDEIVRSALALEDQPAILAWVLGNEIPGWVVDEVGPDALREFLTGVREALRNSGSLRPVGHGNWPNLRGLDLDRDLDLACYNVYPFYPAEVAVRGYGAFLREEILPLARGRPLLITEFGINTIEAPPERQAEILRRCWRELLDAGCQGGVVFEFADEWWKNYDNPIEAPDWWRRVEAPEDHLTADRDPEEHYGIVDTERRPKPAYAAVAAMFAEA